jgi:hypothetical protein
MKSLRKLTAAFAAVCLMSAAAFAADPSGTWTFAGGGRGGGGGGGAGAGAVNTLVLAAKDGKVTGKLTSPGRQGGDATTTEITNGAVKDDTVTFSVERTGQDGTKRVSKYSGKLAGDTITGTVEAPGRDGTVMPREWVAKRADAAAK